MPDSFTVTLPWPRYDLGGNGRQHWAKTAELKRGAKADGFGLAYEALGGRFGPFQPDDWLSATVTYCPPDRRKRDMLDNLPASCKPMIDGVFKALGVDDSRVRRVVSEWGDVTQGGQVLLVIERMKA